MPLGLGESPGERFLARTLLHQRVTALGAAHVGDAENTEHVRRAVESSRADRAALEQAHRGAGAVEPHSGFREELRVRALIAEIRALEREHVERLADADLDVEALLLRGAVLPD